MQFFQELEIVMVKYRLSGEGYTDEEMRVLKHMCKDTLADINEFMRKKEEKKKKERNIRCVYWSGRCWWIIPVARFAVIGI